MAQVGQIIDGKYEILKEVGKGGMSRVYLAMDQRLNKQWAVKEIQKRGRDENNEYVIQSAIAEANLIKSLDHPSIVRITDIIENEDVIYIVEDYIEGETLASILRREGAQPQERVIEWAIQLCEALQYLHSRKPAIIYRDMKPGNVMLRPEGSIKIIDFGIAREYKDENLEDTTCLGTKGYAAPEQFGGKGQTDARTDIYCLGATLYHLLTGKNPAQPPYEMYPIRYWNAELSAGLEAIILKCTKNNPIDRYDSCEELLYALQHYEEYSVEYRAMQLKKVKRFGFTALASVIFIILGIICMIVRTSLNNADYDQNIINAQNAAAATHLDATFRQYRLIAINPLMGISYNENIIPVWLPSNTAQKFHSNLTKVLTFIDDDIRIKALMLFRYQQAAFIHSPIYITLASCFHLSLIDFAYLPYLLTFFSIQTDTTPVTRTTQILYPRHRMLWDDDASPFIHIKVYWQSQGIGHGLINSIFPHVLQDLGIILNTCLIASAAHIIGYPSIEIDHLNMPQFFCCTDCLQVFTNVRCQICRKGRKQHFSVIIQCTS